MINDKKINKQIWNKIKLLKYYNDLTKTVYLIALNWLFFIAFRFILLIIKCFF